MLIDSVTMLRVSNVYLAFQVLMDSSSCSFLLWSVMVELWLKCFTQYSPS